MLHWMKENQNGSNNEAKCVVCCQYAAVSCHILATKYKKQQNDEINLGLLTTHKVL